MAEIEQEHLAFAEALFDDHGVPPLAGARVTSLRRRSSAIRSVVRMLAFSHHKMDALKPRGRVSGATRLRRADWTAVARRSPRRFFGGLLRSRLGAFAHPIG